MEPRLRVIRSGARRVIQDGSLDLLGVIGSQTGLFPLYPSAQSSTPEASRLASKFKAGSGAGTSTCRGTLETCKLSLKVAMIDRWRPEAAHVRI